MARGPESAREMLAKQARRRRLRRGPPIKITDLPPRMRVTVEPRLAD